MYHSKAPNEGVSICNKKLNKLKSMQLKVGVTLGVRQQILIPIKAYCSKLPNGDRKLQEFISQLWLPKQPKCEEVWENVILLCPHEKPNTV